MGDRRRWLLVLSVLASSCEGGVVEASSYGASSTDAEGADDAPTSMTIDPTMNTSESVSGGETTSASVTDASAEDPSDASAEDPSGGETVGADDATSTTDGTGSEGAGSTTEGCVAVAETCDGTDEDCDGVIDEGSPSNPACGNCVFLLAADGASYFALCAGLIDWDMARTACGAFGAGVDLAVIDNATDQTAILSLLLGDTWIGLNDLVEEGHWVWVDGTDSIAGGVVVGYDGWGATQPEGLGERCGEIDPAQSGWADATCSQLQPYVCRHPA